MHEATKGALETIDAAMFSGDEFFDEEARLGLREYMDRWQRELSRIVAVLQTVEGERND